MSNSPIEKVSSGASNNYSCDSRRMPTLSGKRPGTSSFDPTNVDKCKSRSIDRSPLSLFLFSNSSSLDRMKNLIEKIMARREEIDSKANAMDAQHDLPVYHRLQDLLTSIISSLKSFSAERRKPFRSLIDLFFRFDRTLAPCLAELALCTSANKEELEEYLQYFERQLSKEFFQHISVLLAEQMASKENRSFVQQLQMNEKVQLVQWFAVEKHRPLFVFDLLTKTLFPEAHEYRQICQDLLRSMRLSEDFLLRKRAMTFTVPWNEQSISKDEQPSASEVS